MSARHSQRRRRRIAPRLRSGERRVASGNALPPIVKYALRVIAEQERRSLSWVIETILIDWAREDRRLHKLLGAHAVDYVPRKTPEPDDDGPLSVAEAMRVVAEKVGR